MRQMDDLGEAQDIGQRTLNGLAESVKLAALDGSIKWASGWPRSRQNAPVGLKGGKDH
jgi:hypothetical protein